MKPVAGLKIERGCRPGSIDGARIALANAGDVAGQYPPLRHHPLDAGATDHEDRHEPAAVDHARHRRTFPAPGQAQDRPASTASRFPLFEGDAAHYKTIRKELDNHGLGCTTVTVVQRRRPTRSAPTPPIRAGGLERIKWAIEMTAILGGENLCGPVPLAARRSSPAPGRPPTRRSAAADVLRQAAEIAQKAKVMLAIEYLNRFECYFLTTAADARGPGARRVDHPHFRTMYDTFHANIEEKDVGRDHRRLAGQLRPRPHQRERPRHAGHRPRRTGTRRSGPCARSGTTAGW